MTPLQVTAMLGYGMGIGVALAAPIGPINIEIIRRGIQFGPRSGWLVGLGALSADTVFALLIVSGLTNMADSPTLRAPLFAAGALMLGWVGWNSIRAAVQQTRVLRNAHEPGARSFSTGLLMAALNPMGIVYWLSVGSALVAESVAKVGKAGSPLLVGGVFLGIFCWVSALSILVRMGRKYVTDTVMRWISGISGAVLIGFGIWFGIQTLRSLDVF